LEKFAVPPRRLTQQIDASTNSLIELEKKLSTEKQSSTKYGAELLPLIFISEVIFGSDDPNVAVKLLKHLFNFQKMLDFMQAQLSG
jgi:hypothetical protein